MRVKIFSSQYLCGPSHKNSGMAQTMMHLCHPALTAHHDHLGRWLVLAWSLQARWLVLAWSLTLSSLALSSAISSLHSNRSTILQRNVCIMFSTFFFSASFFAISSSLASSSLAMSSLSCVQGTTPHPFAIQQFFKEMYA